MTGYSTDAELLDAVDELDRIIGSFSRAEIHRCEMRHRACHILVFNSADKIFIQRRALHKDSEPGLWDSSCAGHVDSGESYLGCAHRELKEELGISCENPLQSRFMLDPSADTGWEFVQVYTLLHDGPMSLHPDELIGGQWLSKSALQHWIENQPETLTQGFMRIWALLQQSNDCI